MKKIEVTKDIYFVGALDKNIRVFDIIMTTESGTTYNSYILKGSKKTALIECVKTAFFDEHIEKIKAVCDPSEIDYLVLNHTEPDHSGSVERFLTLAPKAVVLASSTAISFLKEIINKPFPHSIVTEKDSFDLGGMTLEFLMAPMLHWPDTMFTYVKEKKALFPCDCFGCHYADDEIFNDKISGDFFAAYKYYFDNIIGPYKIPHMVNALKKIENLDIELIGTGHGPVLRENIPYYIDMYRKWCATPEKDGKTVAIAYVSAYGYTKSLAQKIAEGLKEKGVKVEMFDLVTDDKTAALASIGQADGFLLGSPTMVGDALAPVLELLLYVNPVIHKGKLAGAFGSYGWSGEAVPNLLGRLAQLRLKTPLEGLKVRLKPTDEDLQRAYQYGADFAAALGE
ncbi:MAG: FprA family A-type flavoprotein [Clostridia bacterium]|nr:FprA family A-type flavoprotein [Clostridia bacterium]